MPNGAAVDPRTDTIYVESGGGTLSVINGKTDKVSATITLPSPAPRAIAVDPVTDKIYVVNYGGAHAVVSVIGGKTNKVIATKGGKKVKGVARIPTRSRSTR